MDISVFRSGILLACSRMICLTMLFIVTLHSLCEGIDTDWARATVSEPSFPFYSVSWSSADNVVAVGHKGSGGIIVRSTDGGVNWATSTYGA